MHVINGHAAFVSNTSGPGSGLVLPGLLVFLQYVPESFSTQFEFRDHLLQNIIVKMGKPAAMSPTELFN